MTQREIAIKLGKTEYLLDQAREEKLALSERKKSLLAKVREEKEEKKLEDQQVDLTEVDAEILAKETVILDLEKEVKDLTEKLDKEQDVKEDEERGKKMSTEIIRTDDSTEVAEREAINVFIRSKGTQVRAGFTSVEGAAVIPTDTVTKPGRQKTGNGLDLGGLIRTVPVKTGSGSYPILKKTEAVMSTVAELVANPELANPEFLEVDYKIETYRGAVPIAQEAIDDADVDLVALIEEHVGVMAVNTDNQAITTLLKAFTKKTVASLDEIKKIINVDIDPAYDKSIVISQTFYNMVDTLKDTTGKYVLQEDLTSPTGYRLFGLPMHLAKDTQLGTTGKANLWIGDLYEAVAKFDRKQISAKWQDHDIYGEKLQAGKRMDIKTADAAAGFFVTATALTVGSVTP